MFAVLLDRVGSGIDSEQITQRFHLSAREHETIQFLALGLTNKDIADRMNVRPNTVKALLRTIMFKTGASTRSGILGRCTARLFFDNSHSLAPRRERFR
jgi:DNA-binding CsgD family transcriptional regulator